MSNQISRLVRTIVAVGAGEWFLSCMNARVFDDVTAIHTRVRTHGAFVAAVSLFRARRVERVDETSRER